MHLVQQLKKFPFHLAGIILFFLTHGYSEYIGLIPFADMLYFFGIQLLVASLFFFFFLWRLRSITKAGILTTFVMLFCLFYGAIADTIRELPVLSRLSQYRYMLSAFILGMVLLFFYLKRSVADFQKTTLYLNCLFISLTLYDIGFIAFSKGVDHRIAKEDAVVHDWHARFDKKPDIYFIVMDEYSGSNTLRRYLHYDNSGFENFLKQRGFFVAASPLCNYTATSYSVASTLSMDYLQWLKNRKETAIDYATADKVISNNNVMQFLKLGGYELYNYSIFDIGGQPSCFNSGLFSFKLKLITSKMLFTRMERDLSWIFRVYVGNKISWIKKSLQAKFKAGNERILHLTRSIAEIKGPPKFVYAHLLMPHEPFLYDSTGKAAQISLNMDAGATNNAYLQYLIYTNKVMAGLIDELQRKTNREAVIILMSDHGFRSLIADGKQIAPINNFNAVYIPGNDTRQFYDSISNVNQFRVLFNSMFATRMPLLPDSCTWY